MKHQHKWFCLLAWSILLFLFSCDSKENGHKTVICIPVYGQSLALGEEAVRVTDFDELIKSSSGRIVTQNLDHRFGYFDNNDAKEWLKKIIRYQKRTFELSAYGMAEMLAKELGEDTLICIFPDGQGESYLAKLNKPTLPYQKLLEDIEVAYRKAKEKGWQFYVPAICWMQGESDITDYPDTDYYQLLKQFESDINADIKQLTHQQQDVRIICYQTNAVTRGVHFEAHRFEGCKEIEVPQAMVDLIRDDTLFWASGPTYPYAFPREAIHIDGIGQKRLGYHEALSALSIIRGGERFRGLIPLSSTIEGNDVIIHFNVPTPPLVLDTVLVNKIENYGFSVITPDNDDIAIKVQIEGEQVRVSCNHAVTADMRVRYAVNGVMGKSGYRNGPRGNLRDSQGDIHTANIKGHRYPLHNWCYQFDMACQSEP